MITSIIIFILIIGFLVLSHEFGHFIVAKISGVKVEEFGLGFPPRVFGFFKENGKIKFIFGAKKIETESTIYSLNLIPFGGFNKIFGEEVKDKEELSNPKSFNSRSITTRAMILLGGVTMNVLVAVLIFYFLLISNGFSAYQGLFFDYKFPLGHQKNFPIISYVAKDSPAEFAGLQPYDIIIKENGKPFKDINNFLAFTKENKGKEIILSVENLKTKNISEIKVTPRTQFPEGEGPIGIGLSEVAELTYQGFAEKISAGFLHSFNILHYSMNGLGYMIKTSFSEHSVKPLAMSVAGPVGIFAVTKMTINIGAIQTFNLIALISLGFAITNILPLPALDGGRLLFLLYEAITRKRVSMKFEQGANSIGFLIIILLAFLVIIKDIWQFKDILIK
ncbi:MAG: M50 family metallopeptidase [Patescibacteria group bacterium]|nr:M50 family metallopeptidase [Patescibacteria group bacterium]